jgi:hypothetical protein
VACVIHYICPGSRYGVQVIGLMMGPFMGCIRSSIASLAESDEMRGVASVAVSLGAIAALQTVVTFTAPLVASPIYAATEHHAPGLIWVIMSALAALAAAVAYTLPNLEEIQKPHHHQQQSAREQPLLGGGGGGGGGSDDSTGGKQARIQ